MRWTGGHDGGLAGQRLGAKEGFDFFDEVFRLHEAARANLPTSHVPIRRSPNMDPARHERLNIRLRRRVAPHDRVHSGRYCDWTVGSEQGCGSQVIGKTVGHLGHKVRAGGRHKDQIGFTSQTDMPHLRLVLEAEEIFVDGVLGQAGQRQRRDELRTALGQDRHDGRTGVLEPADQDGRLVGRDPAGNDE